MKKTICVLLIMIAALSLCSCGKASDPVKGEGSFNFSATDMDGGTVTFDDLPGSLIMINFWEPWCGPCVSEMPDLEKLYQDYKDKGLTILGVFSDRSDADAALVLKECGTTYPIVHYTPDFAYLMTQYVPTTVFFDGEGNLLSQQAYVGSMSYEEWEKVILEYLG